MSLFQGFAVLFWISMCQTLVDTRSMLQSVKIWVEQVAENSGGYYNKIKNESLELRVRGKARASLRETKH